MSRATLRAEQSAHGDVEAAPTEVRDPRASTPERAWWVLRAAVTGARENRLSTTAQALAYSFFLAIPSICLVVLGVFSLVASPHDVDALMQRAGRVMPAEATSLLGNSLH